MAAQRRSAPVPRLDARRAEICRAAAQIFRDRGFDATSVSDIARALGLTKAGRLRHVDLTVAAFRVLGMILWLPRWFRQDGRLTQEQVANDIANLAIGGLIAPARSSQAHRKGLRKMQPRRHENTKNN